jgi:hypothetical protein
MYTRRSLGGGFSSASPTPAMVGGDDCIGSERHQSYRRLVSVRAYATAARVWCAPLGVFAAISRTRPGAARFSPCGLCIRLRASRARVRRRLEEEGPPNFSRPSPVRPGFPRTAYGRLRRLGKLTHQPRQHRIALALPSNFATEAAVEKRLACDLHDDTHHLHLQ